MQNKRDNCLDHAAISATRRRFLKTLGLLGGASILSRQSVLAAPARFANRFQLSVTATVTDLALAWPFPTKLGGVPLTTFPEVHIEFPVAGKDILEFSTYLPPLASQQVITHFYLRVDHINVATARDGDEPNFGLFGEIILNDPGDFGVYSPWGDLAGRVSMVCAAYDHEGDDTTFRFLGGTTVGSHSSAVATAVGSLHIQRPL